MRLGGHALHVLGVTHTMMVSRCFLQHTSSFVQLLYSAEFSIETLFKDFIPQWFAQCHDKPFAEGVCIRLHDHAAYMLF
jgi:hypothetical protein